MVRLLVVRIPWILHPDRERLRWTITSSCTLNGVKNPRAQRSESTSAAGRPASKRGDWG